MVRPAVLALLVCVLTAGAAVISFARGSWLGLLWLPPTALTSNMAWYYARRPRSKAPSTGGAGCVDGGSCGACTRRART